MFNTTLLVVIENGAYSVTIALIGLVVSIRISGNVSVAGCADYVPENLTVDSAAIN